MELFEIDNILDSVSPENINLKSFDLKDKMDERIWDENGMRLEVREHLYEIAQDFIESLNITWVDPEDIIVVGSIAGYNWSRYSDIDLHIVYDFSQVNQNTDLVWNYFDAKKNEWNDKHKNLKLFGYDIEAYVQDSSSDTNSNGIYSIIKDRWIKTPTTQDDTINRTLVRAQAAKLINIIDKFELAINTAQTDERLRDLNEQLKEFYHLLVKSRRDGIDRFGEQASDNIAYKVIRRTGHLQKIWDLRNIIYDKIHSME